MLQQWVNAAHSQGSYTIFVVLSSEMGHNSDKVELKDLKVQG